MVWKTSYNMGLGQPAFDLTGVDTVARVGIGTIIKGFDDVFGEGEFIYLPGVASTVGGDTVVYDLLPGAPTSARTLAATHLNSGRPLAVALVAVGAGSYGWFQIGGCAIVNATAASAVGKAMLTATAGSVNSAAVAGSQLVGATLSSGVGTPAAGKAYMTLNRPCVQSQIT